MNKQIASINKLIQFQDFKRNWQLHQNKIRNVKPTLTTRTDHSLLKVNIGLNKTAKQPFGNSFNRMMDIEFQNKALLKKLTDKNKTLTPQAQSNHPHFCTESHFKLTKNNKKKYFQQHQRRLQNQGLLKRIKDTKPLYQMHKYMTQRKNTQKYINTISKFGYKNYKPNKTILKCQFSSKSPNKQNSKVEHEQNLRIDKKNLFFSKQSRIIQQVNNSRSRVIQPDQSRSKIHHPHHLYSRKNKILNNYSFNTSLNNNHKQQQQRDLLQNNSKTNYKNKQKSCIQNNSSIKYDRNSRSNSPLDNSTVFNLIPERQIKINGKHFTLKGKQFLNKIRLQLLQSNKNSIGSGYVHQVQISNETFVKRFQARIDILIENLNFCKERQTFSIR